MSITAPSTRSEDSIEGLPTGLRIGGRVVDGRAPQIPVTNPATGEVFTHVAGASEEDID